jgi:hypothetical protein
MNAERHTPASPKALPVSARKAAAEKAMQTASPKAKAGIARIDYRELTVAEKKIGERLAKTRRREKTA